MASSPERTPSPAQLPQLHWASWPAGETLRSDEDGSIHASAHGIGFSLKLEVCPPDGSKQPVRLDLVHGEFKREPTSHPIFRVKAKCSVTRARREMLQVVPKIKADDTVGRVQPSWKTRIGHTLPRRPGNGPAEFRHYPGIEASVLTGLHWVKAAPFSQPKLDLSGPHQVMVNLEAASVAISNHIVPLEVDIHIDVEVRDIVHHEPTQSRPHAFHPSGQIGAIS